MNRLQIIILILFTGISGCRQKAPVAFIEKLGPSVKGGGFKMEDYWIRGASVIKGEDGTKLHSENFERSQLLIENGKPVCLYWATGDGSGGFNNTVKTWNVVTPLKK